jgi:hypothetical protein
LVHLELLALLEVAAGSGQRAVLGDDVDDAHGGELESNLPRGGFWRGRKRIGSLWSGVLLLCCGVVCVCEREVGEERWEACD